MTHVHTLVEYPTQVGTQSNAQRETQLLAEWLATVMVGSQSKTHVRVGAQTLQYNGAPLSPAMMNAFSVWSDWADARVFTGNEVWLVEAKIVGTADGYGQLLDYVDQYPSSADYQQFPGRPVVGILLCAYGKPRTARLFAQYGIRTMVWTPTWASKSLSTKIFGSAINL